MLELPKAEHKVVETPAGRAIGASYAWHGGQYCAIHTARGVVGCGIYDLKVADEFGMAVAIARGTPANPLRTPEDLLTATIVGVTRAAAAMQIQPGMTGQEAVEKMLRE